MVKWDEKFRIGVGNIDYHHRKLVQIIADLEEYEQSQEFEPHVVGDALDTLCEYTKYHFKAEEEFMEKVDYPQLTEHKKIHISFIEKVVEMQSEVKNKETLQNIIFFLSTWLIHHIKQEDGKIGTFIDNNLETN